MNYVRPEADWAAGDDLSPVASGGPSAPQPFRQDWRSGAPTGPGVVPAASHVLESWRILMKWRWAAAAGFLCALAAGAIVILLTPPLYSAAVLLQIDREGAKIVQGQDLQPSDGLVEGPEFYQTQYGLLRSRSLAERVVSTMKLAEDPAFLRQGERGFTSSLIASLRLRSRGPQQTPEEREAAAVALVQRRLIVTPVRASRLVTVSFQSPDPALAARVANAVAETFIATNLERRYDASSYARTFLEGRLEEVRRRLEESERALVDYAGAEQIVDTPPSSADPARAQPSAGAQPLAVTDLAALDGALNVAKSDRIAAEARWREADGASGGALPEVLQSPAIATLRASEAELAARYSQNLSLYKPDYPTMVALKAQMTEMDRQIADQVALVKQSLRTQYDIARDREDSLQSTVAKLKAEVIGQYGRSVRYGVLQRDVDTNRALYDGLLQRYKEIGLAGGVGVNNISIVDRAEPSTAPFRPKPLLDLGVAAAAGAILAVLAAFGLEAFDESILSPGDIEGKLGVPFLGSIPILRRMTPQAALENRRSPLAEAYQSARAALQFSGIMEQMGQAQV